ncbi:hypothetical protein [Kutzneria kofuensis]|uniref:hypothetical protein n=1 Tax=Kutzneria kofuensis TaxID=103725 RepID=UPI0031EF57CF
MTAEQHRGHRRPQSGGRATLMITLGALTASLLTTVVPATASAAPPRHTAPQRLPAGRRHPTGSRW